MAKTVHTKPTLHLRIPEEILERLPENRLLLYAHLWELETWLREMVYVELVSQYGSDWAKRIEGDSEKAQEGDSRLRHMPTREKLSTSYILFSQLRKTINKQWELFSEYLPPQDIWEAKLNEVEQIRHRVAHFRRGHPDDINRVQQLLRDIDKGLWNFCTSYNDPHPIIPLKTDPIAREFAALDPFPWTEVGPNEFVRIGHAPGDLVMSVTVELLRRPWLKGCQPPGSVMGDQGYFYDVRMNARENREFNYRQFLESTMRLHDLLCHICLDASSDGIRITIPTVAGIDIILPALRRLVDAAKNTLRRKVRDISFNDLLVYPGASAKAVNEFAMQWPEYVLGPSNPLTFLSPDVPCKFFGVP